MLVALYVQETGTSIADAWVQALDGKLWLTPFHRLEFRNAIELRLYRREITKAQAAKVLTQFADDRNTVYEDIEFPSEAFAVALELSAQRTSRVGTRSLDTLHIASAVTLKATEFWTFDERQARAARDVFATVRFKRL